MDSCGISRVVLGVYISRHRNMLIAKAFLRWLIQLYGKRTVYSDVVHDILKHVTVWDWSIDCIHPMIRAL